MNPSDNKPGVPSSAGHVSHTLTKVTLALFALFCSHSIRAEEEPMLIDPAQINHILDAKGSWNGGQQVLKFSWPRNDLTVKIDGTKIPPFMGLTTWAAFHPSSKTRGMVAGDIVLTQEEVNPAIDAALNNGLEVTALHNHFFYEEPRIFFMHIGGEGKVEDLAAGVRKVLDSISMKNTDRRANPHFAANLPDKSSLTVDEFKPLFEKPLQGQDGMVKITFGRYVKMKCGCEVGPDMGIASWAAFYGSDNDALVDGDLALTDEELQKTLKSLRASGISIVALHNHMTDEKPKLFFVHYMGRGPAIDLAQKIKNALDAK